MPVGAAERSHHVIEELAEERRVVLPIREQEDERLNVSSHLCESQQRVL